MSAPSPTVLVTNDDGVRAPGLRVLADALRRAFGSVTVVAPDRERSGVSHALSLTGPLRVSRLDDGWYAVDGTPTDCVNVGRYEILGRTPDLVVAGINAGFNLGDDLTYSGTVGGALEGRLLGAQGLAVSCDPEADGPLLSLAARIAVALGRRLLRSGLPDGFLNVNVPAAPRGVRVTRQGRRADRKGLVERRDPKGRPYYWIGLAPPSWIADPHADHAAVAAGFVSVTPLRSDWTDDGAMPALESWNLSGEGLL